MPKFNLTLKGNKAVLKGLEKVKQESIKKIEQEIEATAYDIHAGAVNRVPVDTGFLKNSLSVQTKGLEARVEAGVHYAPYVEFGTGGLVDVPAGLEEYALRFKGKGIKQVNLPPRPFLFTTFEQERPKLVERIRKVINSGSK